MYTIYARANPPCPYCQRAKAMASSKNLDHKVVDIGTDITVEEFSNKFPAAKSIPVILFNDEVIGGFTEFEKHVTQQSMSGLSL